MLACYDRLEVADTLPGACYAEEMTAFLSAQGIRIFDCPRFAAPLRDAIRPRAGELAASAGIEIELIRKDYSRKEDVVAKVLERRGDHPGLVHIISAMEACQSYKPWHDKASHKTFLKPDTGKCLHYYFIDPVVGLCYLPVPSWYPFRLQFYFVACVASESSNVSSALTATTSAASAAPPSRQSAPSRKCASFRLSQPRCSEIVAILLKSDVVRD